jgi:ribosomal protein S18 acetylase RimI-like enzyme
MDIRRISKEYRPLVNAFLRERWFSTVMVIRRRAFDLSGSDGFLLSEDGRVTALITFRIAGKTCEITSLDSLIENRGAGTALVESVIVEAAARGCRRVRVVTTNDNVRAIRFYQKRGFDLKRLYRNSLERARKIKPEIPAAGENGIPLKHELEFEHTIRRQKGRPL